MIVRTRSHGRFAVLCDWVEDLEAADGDLLDPDALARDVVAAYGSVELALPSARHPTAVIRLKGRFYTQSDATT